MDMEIFGREKHTLLSCQGSVCVCVGRRRTEVQGD